jgi:hypothetical protein
MAKLMTSGVQTRRNKGFSAGSAKANPKQFRAPRRTWSTRRLAARSTIKKDIEF